MEELEEMNSILMHTIGINNKVEKIEYSIVIPIYNQEKVINKNLRSIIEFTGGTYEILLILDDCTDNTNSEVVKWISEIREKKDIQCKQVKIFKTKCPFFEASCDNLGFKHAEGKYLLEIQADMEMCEKDYNLVLTKPFLKFTDVIGVSGRAAHGFKGGSIGFGKMNSLIEKELDRSRWDNKKFYIHETCCRGPLLLDREKVKELNYLDEINFFLDNSEHDLFARAFSQKGWFCGYVPIEFKSPLEDGSTRKKRDGKNEYYFNVRKNLSNSGFLFKYLEQNKTRKPYILNLE